MSSSDISNVEESNRISRGTYLYEFFEVGCELFFTTTGRISALRSGSYNYAPHDISSGRCEKVKKSSTVPNSPQFQLSPEPDMIKEAVCEYYRVDLRDLNRKKGHTFNEPRNVAMYLSRLLRNDTLEELRRSFALSNHSSVSSAITQTKSLMNKNRSLKERVEEIENRLVKRQTKI